MSRPRFIYFKSMKSVFHFQPWFHHNQSYDLKQTHLFWHHFLEYLLLFLDDDMGKESE